MSEHNEIRFPAIKISQSGGRPLYAFVADGHELSSFITVSRLERDDNAQAVGYQRPEVLSHIDEIRSYLDTEGAILPNALVVAFDDRVSFEGLNREEAGSSSSLGKLTVPLDGEAPMHEKPAWIVDGQQRMAALQNTSKKNFEVCVVGFIAKGPEEQREQFMLVNSAKPLPKGLVYELLPRTDCRLPENLAKRQLPARLMDRLNYDEDSPLNQRIKTHTNDDGVIKDTSILDMIENSMRDGVLYRFRNPGSGDHDVEAMVELLKNYWRAVSEVFPDAWNSPPSRSRLTHGAGIISMGYVMDAICDRYRTKGLPSKQQFVNDLEVISPKCNWTEGVWEFGDNINRRWNDIQNTSQDRRQLANHIMMEYWKLVGTK
jgi:DGQHR domain-containing protein